MRQTNIEVLRPLAMLFITLSHWGGHGSWGGLGSSFLLNDAYLQYTQYLGELGNCIFILITGYFCSTRSEFKIGSLKRVILDVKLYAFLTWLFAILIGIVVFTWKQFLCALFPVIMTQYWFILPYLVVFFVSPLINRFLRTPRKVLLLFILYAIAGVVIFCIHTFMYVKFIWIFFIWYSIGGLMRQYNIIEKIKSIYIVLLLSVVLLSYLYIVFADYIFINNGVNIVPQSSFFWRFSPAPILGGAGIMFLFMKHNFQNELINVACSSAFSVYLISENPIIHPWLWKIEYIDNVYWTDTLCLIPGSLIICLFVMVVCMGVDCSLKTCFHRTKSLIANVIRK